MKLRTKAVLIVGLVLVFALGTATVMMMRSSTADLREALQGKALVLGRELVQEISSVINLGVSLEDLQDLSLRCEEIVASHKELAFALVVDPQGVIRFHSDEKQAEKAALTALLDGSGSPVGVRQYSADYGGELTYNTLIPVHDKHGAYRASVIIGLKSAIISQKVSRQVRYALLLGAVSFAGSLMLIILFFTNQVSRPLSSLVKSATAAGRGDLKQNIHVKTRDEIGELSLAFGEMLGQIHKRDTELERHRQHLEEMVEIRTAELARTNVSLEQELAERERAEQALRKSEDLYRGLSQEFHALLDAIPDSIALRSPTLEVLWANSGAAHLINNEPVGAVCRHCAAAQHDPAAPIDPCPVRRSFATGESANEITGTVDERFLDVRTIPLPDQEGNVRSVIEVARDITAQRRLEEQLRHSQKIEAVGQLTGGVAHEFNNILTGILGFASLIQMKLQDDDVLQSYALQIINSTERAAGVTHGLLAFSRKQMINPKSVDMNSIIRMTGLLLTQLVPEDIEFSTNLAARQLTIFADSGQIEQVLMNLVTNARDAMPDGGRITLSSELEVIGEDFINAHGYGTAGVFARVTVVDTGRGMDKNTLGKIFEPFFTTKDVGKGTGLGLAIAYGIIKQHNGFINCYSEPGLGTCFNFYLPLTEAAAQPAAVAVLGEAQRGTETILVAEDDADVRKLVVETLTQHGYCVLAASDGDQAVRIFQENKDLIELLVLDVVMPKKNGREVCDAILTISPEIKYLFTSGYTKDMISKKNVLKEEFNFIFKPFSPLALLGKVREILDGQ